MASRENSAGDSPSADSRHHVPDAAPGRERSHDLDEGRATGRGPKLTVAAVGVAWVTMAVLAVTVFRPELAEVKRVAERAAAIAADPANLAPFIDAGFGGKPATPSSPSPSAPRNAQPAYIVTPPAATATRAAAGTPAAHTPAARTTPTGQPTTPARPKPTASPVPTASASSVPTASASPTAPASPTPTASPTQTASPTPTPTASASSVPTASAHPSGGSTYP